MAQVKNYGLIGVGTEVQLGKQGPKVKGDADTDVVSVTTEGDALTVIRAANAVSSSDLVTKAQLDASASGSNGFELELGNISAEGDGSWTDGAVQTITNSTKISEGLDKINEALENVRNDTFVKSVTFTASPLSGGNPLSTTLTTTVVGNANRYTIDWGDGSSTTATSDSTPSHTYTDNTNSPYDITVTAFPYNPQTSLGSHQSCSSKKANTCSLEPLCSIQRMMSGFVSAVRSAERSQPLSAAPKESYWPFTFSRTRSRSSLNSSVRTEATGKT